MTLLECQESRGGTRLFRVSLYNAIPVQYEYSTVLVLLYLLYSTVLYVQSYCTVPTHLLSYCTVLVLYGYCTVLHGYCF